MLFHFSVCWHKLISCLREQDLQIWCTWSFAGNTGKIAGTVIDKQTGEALIGANVVIKGTNLGAAADLDGKYYILQVPPGKYEVVASFIGYHNMTV